MPGIASYNDRVFAPLVKVGNPSIRRMVSVPVALSASADTTIDFTFATGNNLTVSDATPGNMPMGCYWEIVDSTTDARLNLGEVATVNCPHLSSPGSWELSLVVPPAAGAPTVLVMIYLPFMPVLADA